MNLTLAVISQRQSDCQIFLNRNGCVAVKNGPTQG